MVIDDEVVCLSIELVGATKDVRAEERDLHQWLESNGNSRSGHDCWFVPIAEELSVGTQWSVSADLPGYAASGDHGDDLARMSNMEFWAFCQRCRIPSATLSLSRVRIHQRHIYPGSADASVGNWNLHTSEIVRRNSLTSTIPTIPIIRYNSYARVASTPTYIERQPCATSSCKGCTSGRGQVRQGVCGGGFPHDDDVPRGAVRSEPPEGAMRFAMRSLRALSSTYTWRSAPSFVSCSPLFCSRK